jgi:DNA repair protein RadC
LIGSGNRSAVDLSKRILASVDNNLNALGKVSLSQLIQFKGIGEAKAISIIAALELGGGRAEEVVEKSHPQQNNFEIMQPLLANYHMKNFGLFI